MKNKNQITIFIGIFLLLFGIASGIVLLQQNTIFRLRASQKIAITQVLITNISDNSATISWITTKPTTGFLKWNQTGLELNKIAFPYSGSQKIINSINLSSLSSSTPYSFNLHVDGVNFKNGEYDWSFKTAKKLNITPDSYLIGGQVVNKNNIAISDAIIVVSISGSSSLSTLTDKDGRWSIDLSKARTQTLSNYISIDQQTSTIDINVYGINSLTSIKTSPTLAKNINILLE